MALSAPATPCEMPSPLWMLGSSGPMAMIWTRNTRAMATSAMSGRASDRTVRPSRPDRIRLDARPRQPGSGPSTFVTISPSPTRTRTASTPCEPAGGALAMDEPARDQDEIARLGLHPVPAARAGLDGRGPRHDVDVGVVAGVDVPAGDHPAGRPDGPGPDPVVVEGLAPVHPRRRRRRQAHVGRADEADAGHRSGHSCPDMWSSISVWASNWARPRTNQIARAGTSPIVARRCGMDELIEIASPGSRTSRREVSKRPRPVQVAYS